MSAAAGMGRCGAGGWMAALARCSHEQARTGGVVRALVLGEWEGEPLLVSGGGDGALRSWRLDGSPARSARQRVHSGGVVRSWCWVSGGEPLLVSGGGDGALRAGGWTVAPARLRPRAGTHRRRRPGAGAGRVEGEPLLVSGGEDGALRAGAGRSRPAQPGAGTLRRRRGAGAGRVGGGAFACQRRRGWGVAEAGGWTAAPARSATSRHISASSGRWCWVSGRGSLCLSAAAGIRRWGWRLDGSPGPLSHEQAAHRRRRPDAGAG